MVEIEGVKKVTYWSILFLFLLITGLFVTAERLAVIFRVILVLLLALLSSKFHLEDRYAFLAVILTLAAGLWTGLMLANDAAQFWIFSFLFVVVFFLSCELWARNILKIHPEKKENKRMVR